MSYSQFSYTYPSSSQILVSSPHPMSVSPCCPTSTAGDAAPGGGGEARLLSPFPRLAPAGFGLYGYTADPHLSALSATTPSAFYPSLPSPYDLKESRTSWSALQPSSAPACYPYDPSGLTACGPYGDRYSTIDSVARRKNATRETTNTLKAWLYEHRKNPYPTKGEKIMLAIITKMTLTQVSTWFANARRRLKKENKMTWEPRNKTSEGEDRDSSSPRDKSDDNTNDDGDSNMTSSGGVPTIDFLKQESDSFVNKSSFSEFDDPGIETKTISHMGKNCVPYGMNCGYKPQSSEDSGTSGSPSPARSLQVSCYGEGTPRFDPSKSEVQKDVYCESTGSFGSRPKIWSLARTATSNSPPLIRRYQCSAEYCLDKEDGAADCNTKSKAAGYGCSVGSYPEYAQDNRTNAQKIPGEDLCCDRSAYGNILPSCSVPAKCESAPHCLGPSERNSCMVKNPCSYAADYHNGGGQYPRYKNNDNNKDLCAIEYASTKCQPLDTSIDGKKLTMLPYPGSESSDFYNSAGGEFDQVMLQPAPPHKSARIEIPDSTALLRGSDR